MPQRSNIPSKKARCQTEEKERPNRVITKVNSPGEPSSSKVRKIRGPNFGTCDEDGTIALDATPPPKKPRLGPVLAARFGCSKVNTYVE